MFNPIDLTEFDSNQIEFPVSSEEDILGDQVLFRVIEDGDLSPWYTGCLSVADPMVDDLHLKQNHIFYHRFPSTGYIYFQIENSLAHIYSVLEEIDIETLDYSIIYPPILIFPDQFPATLKEVVMIDIWLATDSDVEQNEKYVEIAKVYRSYSFNYVKSMLDFSNLPDYKS